ncbi:hypothetical protein HDK77DRAFT_310604 [Phyllosticta capitalensis]
MRSLFFLPFCFLVACSFSSSPGKPEEGGRRRRRAVPERSVGPRQRRAVERLPKADGELGAAEGGLLVRGSPAEVENGTR